MPPLSEQSYDALLKTLLKQGLTLYFPPSVAEFLGMRMQPRRYRSGASPIQWTVVEQRQFLQILLPMITTDVARIRQNAKRAIGTLDKKIATFAAEIEPLIRDGLVASDQLAQHLRTAINPRIVTTEIAVAQRHLDRLRDQRTMLTDLLQHYLNLQPDRRTIGTTLHPHHALLTRLTQTISQLQMLIAQADQWIPIITPWYYLLSATPDVPALSSVLATFEVQTHDAVSALPPLSLQAWQTLNHFEHNARAFPFLGRRPGGGQAGRGLWAA